MCLEMFKEIPDSIGYFMGNEGTKLSVAEL